MNSDALLFGRVLTAEDGEEENVRQGPKRFRTHSIAQVTYLGS